MRTATRAAVVTTLEPMFAAMVTVAAGGERLSAVAAAGGLIMVAAMFLAELGVPRLLRVWSRWRPGDVSRELPTAS